MYVVVAGINSMSKRLVSRLEGRHDVVAIDEDEDKCERLYSSSGATVINKSPSTITALEDAGITQADVLIASQKSDNENMVVCSLAKKYGVPKVVTRVEDDEYHEAFQIIGAQPLSHNDILVSEFLSAVEHPYLVKLANLDEEREMLKGSVEDDSKLVGMTLDEVKSMNAFPAAFKVSAVLGEDETVIDTSERELSQGDEIILIGPEEKKKELDKFFKRQ